MRPERGRRHAREDEEGVLLIVKDSAIGFLKQDEEDVGPALINRRKPRLEIANFRYIVSESGLGRVRALF